MNEINEERARELFNQLARHNVDERGYRNMEAIRSLVVEVAMAVKGLVPEGRECALAITKLQEALMWANSGISRQYEALPILEVPRDVHDRSEEGAAD